MIYLSANGEVIGQFDEGELPSVLAAGKIPPGSLFWREGMPDWRPLRELVLPPRPLQIPPGPKTPAPSPGTARPESSAPRAPADRLAGGPMAPAIAPKKPFVPRSAPPAKQPAPSPQPAAQAAGTAQNPENPARRPSFWTRLFRQKQEESAKPAVTPAAGQPAATGLSEAQTADRGSGPASRVDALAPKKPEKIPPAPEAPARLAGSGVSPPVSAAATTASPVGSARQPAGTARQPGRVPLPQTKETAPLPARQRAPTPLPPARKSPRPAQISLPPLRPAGPDDRARESPAPGPSTAAASATGAEKPSGKAGASAPSAAEKVAEKTVTKEASAKAPVAGLAGAPLAPNRGPEVTLAGDDRARESPVPGPSAAAASATGAEKPSGKAGASAPSAAEKVAEKTVTKEASAKAPVAGLAGAPLAPNRGPEVTLAGAGARGGRGRKALTVVALPLLLGALGAAAWWFFPTPTSALQGEVRLPGADGEPAPAAGADVLLVPQQELAARWRDHLVEARSRDAALAPLLEEAKAAHREKFLVLELAARTSELADEYNMPDAAELRTACDAARAEEAAALAEVARLTREKEAAAAVANVLRHAPEPLERTRTDGTGAFRLLLPPNVDGLVVFVRAGAESDDPAALQAWILPLGGQDRHAGPARLSADNALDAEQIREIAGVQP